MPPFPGVAGTTGYEWLNVLSHVQLDGSGCGLTALDATWRDFTGERRDFADYPGSAKHTRHRHDPGERVRRAWPARCRALPPAISRTRDFTLDRLRAALQLYVLEFPVYRTYVTAAGTPERDRD